MYMFLDPLKLLVYNIKRYNVSVILDTWHVNDNDTTITSVANLTKKVARRFTERNYLRQLSKIITYIVQDPSL